MALDAGIRKYKEAATFIVAASDSLHKERADYVCDGVDDQVEIQAAIDVLPAGGGTVVLLDGTFYLGAKIDINNLSNVWICGQGKSTIVSLENATTVSYAFRITNSSEHIKISDMFIDNHDKQDTDDTEVIRADSSTDITIEEVTIENQTAYIAGFFRSSIRMNECSRIRIIDCNIKKSYGYAIRIHSITATISSDIVVRGCHCENDLFNAIALYGVENFVVSGNTIIAAEHSAIAISPGKDGIIANNTVRDTTGFGAEGGIEVENGHETTGEQETYNISVVGNVAENCYYGVLIRENGAPRNDPHNINITENAIRNCTYGVFITHGKEIVIDSNSITDCTEMNIRIEAEGNHLIISNNILEGCKEGIGLYSSENLIIGNEISEMTVKGLCLRDGATYNQFIGNNIHTNNKQGMHLYSGADYNSIIDNIIINNGALGAGSQMGLDISSDYNIIRDNYITDTRLIGSKTQQYSIYFAASSNNNKYFGNAIFGNISPLLDYGIDNSLLSYDKYSDIFMDVLAASNVHIHAAQAGNSASQDVAATTQPDVPRDTKLTTTNNGQVLEGCLCDDGGTVTDETADINNVAANDVPLLPAAPEENDATYFGNYDKFDKLTIDIGTQGVKAPGDWSIAWEYWDGDSWEALADVVDGTAEFTAAAGNHDVIFTVPNDWAEKEIDITAGGSITAYWIRARVDAATTNPIGAQPLADQGWLGIYGTVTVTGVDAKGNSTTDTLLITRANAGGTVALDVAFATVTKYNIPAGVSAANTVACGIGIKLGLSNIIYATGDVYKIKKNNADATVAVAQVDTDYDTYDMSVIGLGGGDDFTIWFKSNLNIIS